MVAVGGRGRGVDLIPKALRLKGLVENQTGPCSALRLFQSAAGRYRNLQLFPKTQDDRLIREVRG